LDGGDSRHATPHHTTPRHVTSQAVIELGRRIRERATKPVKFPLRKLVVVHPDQHFLDDIKGRQSRFCIVVGVGVGVGGAPRPALPG
jgi:hypothetical protein